jgi:hypothetical protein
MKQVSTIVFLCLLVSMCGKQVKTEVVELPSINPSNIYDFDSVSAFAKSRWEQNARIARAYFNRGEKLEGENLAKAIWHYHRAITLNPLPEYYHMLGQVLIKNKAYNEAAKLYYFLTQTHYVKDSHGERYEYAFGTRPSEEDYYNRMLTQMLAFDFLSGYDVSEANEAGINVNRLKEKLLADERISYDTASIAYKNFLNLFLSEEEIAAYTSNPANFRTFINGIKDTGSVYELPARSLADFNYSTLEQYEAEGPILGVLEMNFLKQKQDFPAEWFNYNTCHAGRISDSVYYVVYAIDSSSIACPRIMRHVYYTLATYSATGKVIDAKSIAWQSGEALAEASVQNDKVKIRTYKRKWRTTYNKAGYDNEITSTESTGTIELVIQNNGVISELKPLLLPAPDKELSHQ